MLLLLLLLTPHSTEQQQQTNNHNAKTSNPFPSNPSLGSDLFVPEDVFDVTYSTDSDVDRTVRNTTRYYCAFRNLWTPTSHPANFPYGPPLTVPPSWSRIALYSTTKDYAPWRSGRAATLGVKTLVENGFVDSLRIEFVKAGGEQLLDYGTTSEAFDVPVVATSSAEDEQQKQHVFLPPIAVSLDQPYLNAIAAIQPSPDWFTGTHVYLCCFLTVSHLAS